MDKRLFELLPEAQRRAEIFLNLASIDGHPLIITETYRSPERQAELYAQGRDKPGRIVTNARPGQSKHETRRAFDVCFPGTEPYSDAHPWRLVGVWAKAAGLEWGGSWTRPDRPHLQYTGPVESGDEPMFPKPISATPTETRPTLRRGDRGPAVVEALTLLEGHPPIGDFYGPGAELAVRIFQVKHGLRQDGICGKETWAALLALAAEKGQRP